MNTPKYNAQMVRYADDIAMKKIEEIIHSVKLSLNTEKSRIVTVEKGFDSLIPDFTRRYYEKAGKHITRIRLSRRYRVLGK